VLGTWKKITDACYKYTGPQDVQIFKMFSGPAPYIMWEELTQSCACHNLDAKVP